MKRRTAILALAVGWLFVSSGCGDEDERNDGHGPLTGLFVGPVSDSVCGSCDLGLDLREDSSGDVIGDYAISCADPFCDATGRVFGFRDGFDFFATTDPDDPRFGCSARLSGAVAPDFDEIDGGYQGDAPDCSSGFFDVFRNE